MQLAHILGYLGAIFTGLILGLLGGGGALLCIPVLHGFFHIEASVASSYSLFLIGITASSGAYQNIRKKMVDYHSALYYGIPSVITIYAVRRFVMPNLPKTIFTLGEYSLDKDLFILLLLSVVMFIAAYKMINSGNQPGVETKHEPQYARLMIFAVVTGAFMGLVGAGGGFLMVPALIYFANVAPQKAIGTSLVLVSINSFIGFIGDIGSHIQINPRFFLIFLFFSIAGVLTGHHFASRIHSNKLKKTFGWFILFMGIYIVVKGILAATIPNAVKF